MQDGVGVKLLIHHFTALEAAFRPQKMLSLRMTESVHGIVIGEVTGGGRIVPRCDKTVRSGCG